MKEKIRHLVKAYGDVSFIELTQEIEGFKGDLCLVHPTLSNVVLWAGVSQEGVDAINELLQNKQIFMKPCGATLYLYYGHRGFDGMTTIDVAKNMKTTVWLPVIFLQNQPSKR